MTICTTWGILRIRVDSVKKSTLERREMLMRYCRKRTYYNPKQEYIFDNFNTIYLYISL
jgi:hypothetical protein